MAKKHKNLDNIPIQWDGDLSKPSDGSAQSSPDNINIVWGGYVPCWYDGNYSDCEDGLPSECHADPVNCGIASSLYFEDFKSCFTL